MNMAAISVNSFDAGCAGRPKAEDGCDAVEMVRAFGARVFSIAKHITQNDDDAGDVLIEAFLEVCPDLDGCRDDEEVWLRLATAAVREAFSKLRNRGEDRPFLDRVVDPGPEGTTRVLEHGLWSLDPMCRTVFVLKPARRPRGIPMNRIDGLDLKTNGSRSYVHSSPVLSSS
jgi:DNA-directed RNA polymerase specialized sigma24 family protein